ncbi:SusC/RagA family TonB-linked outer membrane protein [Pseudopedobacter beijingensis]|uniref:SusC/RagA family TonB-linked outer membrane protein n=1 Tax=Pseudopedobacter beijingensis TaxID=1207056 RepID=A0ABW4IEK1_9SPHI
MILLTIIVQTVQAQTVKISGTVRDQSGVTMPGVNIRVKGSTASAVTDVNGKYAINASPKSVLQFSYLGFANEEITIGALTVINVTMKDQQTSLSEIVVIGYGTSKREDLTGAVGSVNMKEMEQAPVKSFDQALAGRVAGVQVSTDSGQPGSTANIVIRGAGSISQDNSPLFVIDGFPSEDADANSISPSDIESIDILKDASATAIYGARGSNGVVLITTKKGKQGKPQITYNGYYGMTKSPNKIPVMNGYQFVSYVKELNSIFADSVYLKNTYTVEDYRNAESIDMQDHVFHNGQNQNHDIALRGGNAETTYSLSANINDQTGIVKFSGFKRYQSRLALDQKVNKKLKAGININYSYTENYGTPISATNFYASSVLMYSVWGYRPVTSLSGKDDNNNLLEDFYDPVNEITGTTAQDYRVNPYISLSNQLTKYKNTSMVTNAYAEYSFTDKLKLRVGGGFTNRSTETNIFNNSYTQAGQTKVPNAQGPNATYAIAPTFSWLSDNTITYKTTFNKNHHLTLLGGFSAQKNTSTFRYTYASQISDESLGIEAIDLSPTQNTKIVFRASSWTLASVLSRMNYSYQGKYLLTASFRADGSSKFAAGNRWGYFPSASAGWRFSREKFMKNVNFIYDAKLRVGYGASGNNRVGDFAYLPLLDLSNVNYWYSMNGQPGATGAVVTAAGNKDLKWETNEQGNIGLDLSFVKNRISLTIDAYKRITKDLLLNAELPYANGIQSSTGFKNIGNLENRGLEFTVNTTNIQTKNFRWTSNFNISFNKNKIIDLNEGQNILLAGSGTFFNTTYTSLSPYISVKGRSVGEMYGLIFDGVYQYGDFDKMPDGSYLLKPNITTNGATRASIQPGDIKYKDLNGDMTVNADDYTIIGRGLPIHTGGFSNNFTYKNWDLGVFMQWSYGNNIINANRYVFEGGIVLNPSLNQYASYADRWTPTNPSNTLFRAGGMAAANYSSRVVEDGSYLRLKTLQLSYTFEDRLLKTLKISKLKANISAQNLLTFTNYSGLDPEASARPGNRTPGFDYGTYPQSKAITFGLNATF